MNEMTPEEHDRDGRSDPMSLENVGLSVPRLFHVSSVVDAFRVSRGGVYDHVKLSWFVRHDRPGRHGPYPDLIRDYERREVHTRGYVEQYVDELFSVDELEAFRAYMADVHGVEVSASPADLPLAEFIWPLGSSYCCCHDHEGYWMLPEGLRYSLPFKVWGHYDLSGCPIARSLRSTDRARSEEYLTAALASMGFEVSQDRVRTAVSGLYVARRLYVDKIRCLEEDEEHPLELLDDADLFIDERGGAQ